MIAAATVGNAAAGRRAATVLLVAALTASCAAGSSATRSSGVAAAAPAAPAASAVSTAPVPVADVLPPCPAVKRAEPRPDGLPDLRLPCLGEGSATALSDLRGTPTVVTFWAAWCTNCKAEMAAVREVQASAGERVRFVGVHVLAERDFALDSARRFGVTFPSLHDEEGRLRQHLPTVGPPATYFVDADGRLAGPPQIGEIRSAAALAELVRQRLGTSL